MIKRPALPSALMRCVLEYIVTITKDVIFTLPLCSQSLKTTTACVGDMLNAVVQRQGMSIIRQMSTLPFGQYIALSNGHEIPQLGFGVYEMSGAECKRAVKSALEAGYRHVDSAAWYGNERECGQAILSFLRANADSSSASSSSSSSRTITRSDIFYTSKLRHNSTYLEALAALKKSVDACGLGYIDLYLLHSPYPDARARQESWRALEEGVRLGLVKSIGVSNFGERHVRELLDSEPTVVPVINQIDVHPFMTRLREVQYNESQGIKVEAWGPLARGMRMGNATLKKMADKYGKSVAQILIRYSLQRGCIAIPKSVSPSRIIENSRVFDFEMTRAEMDILNALNEDLITDWDPIGDSSV